MSEICILAVDPGLTSAIAFYFPTADAITVDDRRASPAATLRRRRSPVASPRCPDVAIVELVASRPGQGVASVFKFGCGFGMVRGVHRGERALHLVSPAKWKRHFELDADKEKSRALALRLWQGRSDLFGLKRHHGRAEAGLLARYAAERIVSGGNSL